MLQGYDTHCPLDPREPFASAFTKGMESSVDFSVCHWTHEDTKPVYEEGKKLLVVKIPNKNGIPGEIKLSESDIQYMNALYDARIAEMDFYLDSFFKKISELGLEKNTIVVLFSDHGEMRGEHGRFMRGGTTRGNSYEPALNFPLLIKHPKIDKPLVIEDLVQTVDIMPTVLSLIGINDPQQNIRQGKTLALTHFGDTPVNEYIFSATKYAPKKTNKYFELPTASESVRDKKWKLIKETIFIEDGFTTSSVSYKLFDLENDPLENNDVSGDEVEVLEKMKRVLEDWLSQYR